MNNKLAFQYPKPLNTNSSTDKQTSKGFVTMAFMALLIASSSVFAQDVNQIRWKSESQVREILGEPQSTTPPVGTHATYTLWKYEDFTVAFANQRAFHLFKHNSLNQTRLEENRSDSEENGS